MAFVESVNLVCVFKMTTVSFMEQLTDAQVTDKRPRRLLLELTQNRIVQFPTGGLEVCHFLALCCIRRPLSSPLEKVRRGYSEYPLCPIQRSEKSVVKTVPGITIVMLGSPVLLIPRPNHHTADERWEQ